MKSTVISCIIFHVVAVGCLTIPEHLPERCKKSNPKYSSCVHQAFERARPYLIKGIPELKMPPLDPLDVPYISVNRTLNELISINAIMENIKVVGFGDTVIESVKANPKLMYGEILLTVPKMSVSWEHDVNGQLLIIPLRSKGYFEGNFTDLVFQIKANMKLQEKDDEKYFVIDKLLLKSRIGNGHIQVTAKNPQLQFAADLINNFYNENPRLVMDAINQIYVEYTQEFFRSEFNKALSGIPARELLPE